MQWLIYGHRGWIGEQMIQALMKRSEPNLCFRGKARVDCDEEVEKEIRAIAPDRILCVIGRTHGEGIATIDYLEQPGKLVENIRDNLYAPVRLALLCQRLKIHLTYLGTGCIFTYDEAHPDPAFQEKNNLEETSFHPRTNPQPNTRETISHPNSRETTPEKIKLHNKQKNITNEETNRQNEQETNQQNEQETRHQETRHQETMQQSEQETRQQETRQQETMHQETMHQVTMQPNKNTTFHESDQPNYFDSSYSIVKGFTDRLMHAFENETVLNIRIRMPITSKDHPRNFISKIIRYSKICSVENSMTVLDELVPLIIDMAARRITGTVNCTNPGTISHNRILDLYKELVDPSFSYENFSIEEQRKILKCGRSNNHLDTRLLESLYPKVKPIEEAIQECLLNWGK